MTIFTVFGLEAVGSAIAQLLTVGAIAAVLTFMTLGGITLSGVVYQRGAAVTLFTVAFVGIAVGYLGGLSRSSVVGDLVPAILTLIGGISVYLFGLKRRESPLVSFSALAFLVAFFISYTYASILRTDDEAFEFCKAKISDTAILADPKAMEVFKGLFSPYCPTIIARHTAR
ncbi:MAG TPA: hypothetical protein VFB16_12120 [Bauldia sp.]|nr:hypothetical protein [Bauldia sp.]